MGSIIAACWASGVSGSSGVFSTFLSLVARDTLVSQLRRRSSWKSQADYSLRPMLVKPINVSSFFSPNIVGK